MSPHTITLLLWMAMLILGVAAARLGGVIPAREAGRRRSGVELPKKARVRPE